MISEHNRNLSDTATVHCKLPRRGLFFGAQSPKKRSPYEGDLAFLRRMFDDASWRLFTAHTYKEAMTQLSHHRMPLILCECQLPDGKWTDVLSQLAPMPDRPRLIVMSQSAGERLCSEVVRMGGFDVISIPL